MYVSEPKIVHLNPLNSPIAAGATPRERRPLFRADPTTPALCESRGAAWSKGKQGTPHTVNEFCIRLMSPAHPSRSLHTRQRASTASTISCVASNSAVSVSASPTAVLALEVPRRRA